MWKKAQVIAQSKIRKSSVSSPLSKAVQVFALHGFTGCGEDFREFSKLCSDGMEWRYPDLPGHGPDPSLDCTPQAIIEFIDAQKLPNPRIVLGYSMGARVALLHAVANPGYWDALVLISANAGIESKSERAARASQDNKLAQRLITDGVPDFLDYWQQTPIIRSQQMICTDWWEQMQQNRRRHTAKGLAASLQQFGQGKYPDLWSQLEKLDCPTLLITGEKDSKYCAIARRMENLLPHAQWTAIEAAGHMPHLEAPRKTAILIRDFRNSFF